MKKKLIYVIVVVFLSLSLCSCSADPASLKGTWISSDGNMMVEFTDSQYKMSVSDGQNTTIETSGIYTVNGNKIDVAFDDNSLGRYIYSFNNGILKLKPDGNASFMSFNKSDVAYSDILNSIKSGNGATENTAPSTSPQPTPEPTTTMTIGQKNALNKAKDYLAYTAFSYTGLIKQLEYEQYSTEDATFAVDNCGADWNEQAAKKAQDYLDYSSFSRDGLISQLEYEGFTPEQAEYGVTAIGY